MAGSHRARFGKRAFGLEYKMQLDVRVVETNNPELANSILACRPSLSGNGEFDFLTDKFEDYQDTHNFVNKYLEMSDSDEDEITIDFPHLVAQIPGTDESFDADDKDLSAAKETLEELLSFMADDNGYSAEEEACNAIAPEENICYDIMPEPAMPRLNIAEDEELLRLEQEKKAFCDKLSFLIADFVYNHNVPQEEIIKTLLNGKILLGNNGFSELVVNNDLKIILPAYNETEIPMQPLTKALYFLFLRHPEGIRLVEFPEYRDEIEDLYSLIMPNRDENLAQVSIDNLCDLINNDTLRQQISKIKRIVTSKILNADTAKQYYISGERGEEYRIPLDRSKVKLPRALM